MKNIFLKLASFFLLILLSFSSCMEDPIKDAQESYDYNAIVPKVLGGVQGPSVAVQTFTADFSVGYHRGGSTWTWTATNGAVVKSLSADTRTATIQFVNFPSNGISTVSVTETTQGGITSEAASKNVEVKRYCPLPNGIADMAGSWVGEDAWYDSEITAVVSGTELAVTGMSFGFITDWWGEEIIEGGTIKIKVNIDGTVTIPRQYIYTTVYDGDPYDYEILGSGTWSNCGTSPSMLITYDIYYEGDAKGLAATYSPAYLDTPYMTADITLDKTKSATINDGKLRVHNSGIKSAKFK
jgi:hypothetical protein